MGQESLHFVFADVLRLRFCVCACLFVVSFDLIFELSDLLTRCSQRICLAIESFVTMTTHTATLHEEIAAEIQRLRTLRDAILRVALLAAGFGILFLKHRPEPETMASVSFDIAGGRTAVAPVTTGTTKLLRIVNLKYFFVGMAYKRARKSVGLTTRTNETGGG